MLLLLEFLVGYSASGGKSDADKDYNAQAPDSVQREIVSDSAQQLSEEKFIEAGKFKKEVLNHFSNQDEILFEEIDDCFVRDLGDILHTRSLLNVTKVGPPGQLETVSWGAAKDLRIFIDGILYEQQSLHLPQRGVLDLNSIPVENIEKIEILPLGIANLWGRGSGLGGINIITKDYGEIELGDLKNRTAI